MSVSNELCKVLDMRSTLLILSNVYSLPLFFFQTFKTHFHILLVQITGANMIRRKILLYNNMMYWLKLYVYII